MEALHSLELELQVLLRLPMGMLGSRLCPWDLPASALDRWASSQPCLVFSCKEVFNTHTWVSFTVDIAFIPVVVFLKFDTVLYFKVFFHHFHSCWNLGLLEFVLSSTVFLLRCLLSSLLLFALGFYCGCILLLLSCFLSISLTFFLKFFLKYLSLSLSFKLFDIKGDF